jgi:branched-chain amino acid aminotransferase
MAEERKLVAYLNGWIVPYEQAIAKIGDGESRFGGFYDAERTFNGQVFKLQKHLERLYHGMEYAKVDPGIPIDKMAEATSEVLDANRHLFSGEDDYVVSQVVSSGSASNQGVNVVIYCQPIEFSTFAWGYVSGVRMITPITYSVPPQRVTPGYNGNIPEIYSLLTDAYGYVTESRHSNFMFVKDGRIKLPDRSKVLAGISMETVLELAEENDIPVDEGDYTSSDVYVADEAFVSGTRYCVMPAATLNGATIGDVLPGPVTRKLLSAWSKEVGMDFVRQALDHLPNEDTQVINTG